MSLKTAATRRQAAHVLAAWGQGGPLPLARRLLWEQPQSLLGCAYALGWVLAGRVQSVGAWGGALAVQASAHPGAISLGAWLVGPLRAAPADCLFAHEYGHALQSRAWGPLYLLAIGLPSLWSAARRGGRRRHFDWPWERGANARAARCLGSAPGFSAQAFWTWEARQG